MGNLISTSSSKSKHHITDVDRAILSLKTQRKKLEDQSKLLEQRIDQQVKVARDLITANKKDRALLALKKKKLNEHQLEQLQALQVNVESMLSNIEVTKQQTKMFTALKEGNEALKKLQTQVKLEDVEQLMSDSAEAKAYQDEMAELLGQSLTEEDATEAEAELAALEAEMEPEPELPSVPTTKIEVPAKPEEAAEQGGEQQAAEEEAGAAEQEAAQEEEEEEEEAGRQLEQPMAA